MGRTMALSITAVVLVFILIVSGYYLLDFSEIHPSSESTRELTGVPKIIFGLHLVIWMVVGMVANYLWDLFRDNKSWQDITWRGLFMPVLVSPIVFFTIWSLWKDHSISLALPLVAFQNGFFWQVIFSKAGPK